MRYLMKCLIVNVILYLQKAEEGDRVTGARRWKPGVFHKDVVV